MATQAPSWFDPAKPPLNHLSPDAPVEYIVIGSGAGGGPLACNLAKAGHKVVLFEAGDDDPQTDFPSDVPFSGGSIADDRRISWGYFVRHYANDEQQRRDPNYDSTKDGVWYPRVGALGGCTVHSLMVEMYPSNSDWEYISQITKDPSWKAENMRKYFERFEQCRYAERPGDQGNGPSRHGFDGWQTAEIPDPTIFDNDPNIQSVRKAIAEELGTPGVFELISKGELDPNDWRIVDKREGVYNLTLFTRDGRRYGPRQLIRETKAALPNNLIVKTNSLVTRILFNGKTAIGVEYVTKPRLYRADPNPNPDPNALAQKETLLASREVILSAGTFNSPQILMLSGIGAADELAKHGIPQLVNLPGVGKNLQDRYEITVVTKLKSDFTFADHCTFFQTPDDPCVAAWAQNKGVYTNTGVINVMYLKSKTAQAKGRPDPDLFIFDAPLPFTGYHEGYSQRFTERDKHTWAILKAHTLNNAGTVTLRSTDPRDTPIINFHYFAEGSDTAGEDLASVVDGVEIVRRFNANQHSKEITVEEICPDPNKYGDSSSREVVGQFIADQSWGHHASCTNKIGPREDPMAVVDNNFRVHGTRNLRVVDASVFPRIPGYFILTPIYMISEKASEVILEDAKKTSWRE
jgi:choline dehydrogenase